MNEDTTDTDSPSTVADESDADSPSRRRLIRWIAVLAFAVPVVVELLTFGGLLNAQLLPGGDDGEPTSADTETRSPTVTEAEGAVGVGDDLLSAVPAAETVEVSEIRGDPGSRTYILRVAVENTTDSSLELRLTGVTLRDETSLQSVSSTGTIPAGGSGEVTGAWSLPTDSMPVAVDTVVVRGGEATEQSVPLKRPPIRG
ncbi:hypothetical protein [Halobaculum marinum]|uniref:DUF4352 domain-containing protein n=1 Tax=Halobaculum marinum TaxID=3031996 RepID=A0ABD5WRI7_9EURY|nr:hypothetical protein [Halobaculum sp. DT55]